MEFLQLASVAFKNRWISLILLLQRDSPIENTSFRKNKNVPADRRRCPSAGTVIMVGLAEQVRNSAGDAGDNGVVEDKGHGCQQQAAQHDGDDNLNTIADVKVSAGIGNGTMGAQAQVVQLYFDLVHRFYFLQLFK